jgi:metallophosphoesterase superfamily enzyme
VSELKAPARASERVDLAKGVVALASGVAWLPATRTLIAADAHLAYEDVVGGALPLWSTDELVARLTLAARNAGAREIVFLGDIVHGPNMSEGAMLRVRAALDLLRAEASVTLVAGNHEGRSKAFAVLGATEAFVERDGWLLVHGDGPAELGRRAIIGHLHPSLRLGGGATAPAFVGGDALVVLPALNPYSPGLDLLSEDFGNAIGLWNVRPRDAHAVVIGGELLYPFGTVSTLRETLRNAPARGRMGPYQRTRKPGPG